MALRPLLTNAERSQILAIPTGTEDLAAHYSLSEADMSLIRQRRGDTNRVGFAVQLCLLRHPGITLAEDTEVPPELVAWLASRLALPADAWTDYGEREQTRQDHARELRTYLGMSAFGITDFRRLVENVSEVAAQTDKGILLVENAANSLRAAMLRCPVSALLNGPAHRP